MFYNSI